jgi:hypothetical protein
MPEDFSSLKEQGDLGEKNTFMLGGEIFSLGLPSAFLAKVTSVELEYFNLWQ